MFTRVLVVSSEFDIDVEIAWKDNLQFDFSLIQWILPGSESDDCKTFPLFIPDVPDDESLLLLVDENDIRELSSPIMRGRNNRTLNE